MNIFIFFAQFTRLDVGEKIYHLSLLGETEFFFRTEKDIMIYTQNQVRYNRYLKYRVHLRGKEFCYFQQCLTSNECVNKIKTNIFDF